MRALLWVMLLGACARDEARAGPDPVRKPTPPPPPPPSPAPSPRPAPVGTCATDLDCRLTSLGEDCCHHCGQFALTAAELEGRTTRCAAEAKACPAIDCPFEPGLARCEGGRCVRAKRP